MLRLSLGGVSGRLYLNAAIAQIHKDFLGLAIGQDRHLLQRFKLRMPIVWVARHATHADHQAFVVGGGDRLLDTEFVELPCNDPANSCSADEKRHHLSMVLEE